MDCGNVIAQVENSYFWDLSVKLKFQPITLVMDMNLPAPDKETIQRTEPLLLFFLKTYLPRAG